jgi:hypothetical protein
VYEAVPCGFVCPLWYGYRLYLGGEPAYCDFIIVCTVVSMPVPVLVAQTSWMHVEKQLKTIQLSCIFECTVPAAGHAVVQLVEALRYKLEGHGFDSRCCHSLT